MHGFTVPATDAKAAGAVPIGLIAGCTLVRDVAAGATVTYADIELDEAVPSSRCGDCKMRCWPTARSADPGRRTRHPGTAR